MDTLVVKDLSRFGRNYLQVGYYTEIVFPKKGVRFIAMEIIVPQLAKAYGVTEQLKAENQIEWVRQMNACVAQAEEAIKGELIYC